MHIRHIDESPRQHRGGQISYLLLTAGDAGSQNLSVTWVEGEPESEQYRHSHDAEQVYVIIAGVGIMHVNGEEKEVGAGTSIFVPRNAPHSIRNHGSEKLIFVTAASPPFEAELIASLYEPPPHASDAT
jgi:mannose-6-phosphate isomerase-like protein (cupin superfamily)